MESITTKKGIKDLLAEANGHITTYTAGEVQQLLGDEDVVFIDVRDAPELQETGTLPGAVHASRGMLEYYVDKSSPYHREVFGSGKELVFYCKSGGRSALAAQRAQEMGVGKVASMAGGMLAWQEAGGPVESA